MIFLLFLFFHSSLCSHDYDVGVGMFDATGSPAEVGFMGYGNPSQNGRGLHYRVHARSFVFVDAVTQKRFAYVNIGAAMVFHEVKAKAVQQLQARYGALYTTDNVMISSTHTHSSVGGATYFALYDITTWGFQKYSFDVLVNAIVQSISRAHNNVVKDVDIKLNFGELIHPQTNINRSPSAYLYNPASERAQYKYNVDKNFTLIRFDEKSTKRKLGMINWFAVHGTSMNNTNKLISADNKGHAMYLFEKYINGNDSLPGTGPFVASFSQSNEGDVSPNTKGAFCHDGTPCSFNHSTCNGRSEGCRGIGPGSNMFQATRIIGEQQFVKARDLFERAQRSVRGRIRFVHQFVDFSREHVSAQWTDDHKPHVTCPSALGDSFAAGTTDGPGEFNFRQGPNSSNPVWNAIGGLLHTPNATQKHCQAPKPILLDTGEMTVPGPWTANILPLQLLMFGRDLVIIGVPGEFTTMSGRRLRKTVLTELRNSGAADANTVVVIAGLCNQYSHYIATPEEYMAQRYEGASTLYGRHTLPAYQQRYAALAHALATNKSVPAGPTPPDYKALAFDFMPPVVADRAPSHFGAVKTQPQVTYKADTTPQWPSNSFAFTNKLVKGSSLSSLVQVEFWGSDPRGHPLTNASYIEIQRQTNIGLWHTVLTDDDWDTQYHWRRHNIAESIITVEWHITPYYVGPLPATFRVVLHGYEKSLFGSEKPFTGISNPFKVQK